MIQMVGGGKRSSKKRFDEKIRYIDSGKKHGILGPVVHANKRAFTPNNGRSRQTTCVHACFTQVSRCFTLLILGTACGHLQPATNLVILFWRQNALQTLVASRCCTKCFCLLIGTYTTMQDDLCIWCVVHEASNV